MGTPTPGGGPSTSLQPRLLGPGSEGGTDGAAQPWWAPLGRGGSWAGRKARHRLRFAPVQRGTDCRTLPEGPRGAGVQLHPPPCPPGHSGGPSPPPGRVTPGQSEQDQALARPGCQRGNSLQRKIHLKRNKNVNPGELGPGWRRGAGGRCRLPTLRVRLPAAWAGSCPPAGEQCHPPCPQPRTPVPSGAGGRSGWALPAPLRVRAGRAVPRGPAQICPRAFQHGCATAIPARPRSCHRVCPRRVVSAEALGDREWGPRPRGAA